MDEEIKLWERYKKHGDQMAARQLYEQMRPLIYQYTNQFRYGSIPMVAVESEARRLFTYALDNYDPTKGAKLSTHVRNWLEYRMKRFTRKYENVARLSEPRHKQMYLFNNAFSFLEDNLGREPSALELAEELKWPMSDVSRALQSHARRELGASQMAQAGHEVAVQDDPRVEETLEFLYYQLDDEERVIMEYLLGRNGRPKLKANEIARRTGHSEAKISRVRARLAREFEKYY